MNSETFFAAALSTLLLTGCGAGLYVPTAADATSQAPLDELVEGRRLYVATCGNCHALYSPTRFAEQTWKENLDEMQLRAKISGREKSLILNYLLVGHRKSEER